MTPESEAIPPVLTLPEQKHEEIKPGPENISTEEGFTRIQNLAEQLAIKNELEAMKGGEKITLPIEAKEIIPPTRQLPELSTATKEELTLKNILALRKKNPEQARGVFTRMLNEEYKKGRLTEAQLSKFVQEVDYVNFRDIVRDLAVSYGMEIPAFIIRLSSLGLLIEFPILSTLSVAGLLRAPYLFIRSIQELNKIRSHEGIRSALRRIPYFTAANLINLVNFISPLGTLMVSFPRNKDVGLAFINHKIQTSKAPVFIKNGVNGIVQRLFEKPKRDVIPLRPALKPLAA